MPQVGGLADKFLFLDARSGHPCLDHVAVCALALFQSPGRPLHPEAAVSKAMWFPGLPEQIPELQTLVDRDVQLPAEVPDVRDARRQHAQRIDLDRPARAEFEAFV